VQNINAPNNDIKEIPKQYEVSIINTIYSWFDWLIYINMLLAQVDMFLLELTTDVIAIYFVTGWYIKNRTAIAAMAAMQTETTAENEANLVPTTFVSD
jgi:hypothetical protein